MEFIPGPNMCEVKLQYAVGTKSPINTLGFYSVNGWNSTLIQNLSNNLAGWWLSDIAPLVHSSVALIEVSGRDISVQQGPVGSFTPPVPYIGELGGAREPLSISKAIKFTSGIAGKNGRGRNFTLGWTKDQTSNDSVVAGVVSLYVAAYERIRVEIAPDWNVDWGVISKRFENDWRDQCVFYQILGVSVSGFDVDSQRERVD